MINHSEVSSVPRLTTRFAFCRRGDEVSETPTRPHAQNNHPSLSVGPQPERCLRTDVVIILCSAFPPAAELIARSFTRRSNRCK